MGIRTESIIKNSRNKYMVKRLYTKAFPIVERMPFWMAVGQVKRKAADFLSFYDGEELVGFAYNITGPGVTLVYYLAVQNEKRGRGYGSKILEIIKEKYSGNRIVLEIETVDPSSENYEQRLKRKRFYLKNGFEAMNLSVMEFGVKYDVLTLGGPVTKEELAALLRKGVGSVFYRFCRMKFV